MRVGVVIAAAVCGLALAGVIMLRPPAAYDAPDCRGDGPADGVYVPVLTELAGPPACGQTESATARRTRRQLRAACGVIAAGALTAVIAMLLRRRTGGPLPPDSGFPRA